MKGRIYIVASFIFAILQPAVLPMVFFEGFLTVLYILASPHALVLFLSGIIFDIFQNKPIGASSLIFLLVLALFKFLKNSVIFQKAILTALLVALINAVRSKMLFGFVEVLPLTVIFIISYLVFRVIWRPDLSGKIRI